MNRLFSVIIIISLVSCHHAVKKTEYKDSEKSLQECRTDKMVAVGDNVVDKDYEKSIPKCLPGEILVCKKIEVKEVDIVKVNPSSINFSDFPIDDKFLKAVELNISYLTNLSKDFTYNIAGRNVNKKMLLDSTLKLKEIILTSKTPAELKEKLIENFDFYEVLKGTEPTTFSSYYEPIFEASLKPDQVYKYPIYKKPDDMIEINLEEFDSDKYKGQKLTGKLLGTKLIPYYTRSEIDFDGVLKGKGYEIAYLKDITDVLDLHTQGSGILKMKEGGYKRAKFAATNSHKFKGWMTALLEKGYIERKGAIGQDKTFYDRAREFINQNPQLWREIIGANKRYAFFYLEDLKSFDEGPIGTYGFNLIAHRSIAIDNSIIPLGMPAFISVELPVVDDNLEIKEFKLSNRFVFCHDTGGAIKGARVDYFAGTGDKAKKFAYSVWKKGNLYLMVLKEELR